MRSFFSKFFFLFFFLFFFSTSSSIARAETPRLYFEKNGEIIGTLAPHIPSLGSLALGDLGTDGVSEIIASTGYGTPTRIFALRKDGSTIGSFSPYADTFLGGASVSLCDIDRDGLQEIITGAGFSGGPHVRIFENDGSFSGLHFFAYDSSFLGGVSVHCTDVTGDGIPEIITAPGPTGGPHIKIFTASGALLHEIFLSDFPRNSRFALSSSSLDSRTVFIAPLARATSSYASLSIEHDHLISHMHVLNAETPSPVFFSHEDSPIPLLTSNSVSSYEQIGNDYYRISGTPTTPLSVDTSPKSIIVDVSTQQLTAYEYGIPAFSFLVSTGIASHPTPLGKTEVMAKLPVHDYVWSYGVDHPSNYRIPRVLWNLRFRQHYYIHSAYWHNNFGVRMSHGCVNTSIADAEKIFHWADIGTPVEIVP